MDTPVPVDVLIPYNADLDAVLYVLRIPHVVLGANIQVPMTPAIDEQLEALVGAAADLRWRYTPGRSIQLELPRMAGGTA